MVVGSESLVEANNLHKERRTFWFAASLIMGLGLALGAFLVMGASGGEVLAGRNSPSADGVPVQVSASHAWLLETVDTGSGYLSLALEPISPYTPHIAYYVYLGDHQSMLRHAWWTAAGWLSETVDSIDQTGQYASLALEPTVPYTAHVAYYTGYPTYNLKHAWRSSNGWLSETVEAAGTVGLHTALAIEPAPPHRPHISYYDGSTQDLKHAWRSSTGWLSETVDAYGDVGWYTSLALEPTSPFTPHISYYFVGAGDLKYAWRSAGGWLSETVDSVAQAGLYTSLALEPVAPYTPHISYQVKMANAHLKHAWLGGGTWHTEVVDNTGSDVGEYTSLALEPITPFVPHISYRHSDGNGLKHAWWTPSGWLSETAVSDGSPGWYSSLALEPDEPYVPHIAFYDDTNYTVRHAWMASDLCYLPLVRVDD